MTYKLKCQNGFSLIELLIVVSIIGILAGVIYPSYTRHAQSSYRAQAQADLLALATAMEKHRATTFSYAGAAGTSDAPTDTGAPWIYDDQSPSNTGSEAIYNLTIQAVGGNGRTYEIRATPVASGPVGQGSMKEGIMSYFSDGRKAIDADHDGAYSADEFCWKC
ncbi:prepilin-type N-terminal cleavage/methylation domain-containing protein [Psychrosphaera sp. B3R10]|uniref:Prepilin-type N-terminal cleavage/methylation domain-containing protein n=1 Tax=Psychrosphaera algicola TaxID=3023714 RepID=A0ABT5FCP9_9GAMM|nr:MULTISPECIES: type IV pilin protein [unclassified Psychrosphaera]MBU2881172.1 prepilin-type N-terminal cleavage/methylation domain-containing protein [Psychrosphaera sp. I2R16]MBU2988277.1 prepilin-type N-terminal cleavage/methylation domain-containing protein [Psychrosphaera sp. B3R10]MDC2888367.1 prepilin-type N-terminal cleavage/methylation domain-containing protein [Psychrosphaera sp. G1-22]MDO6718486.1 type IV pilin protein [Psychrosphaera sp. 1_MG-2023]